MSKLYHTLLVRDHVSAPWCIHFGDYDRSVVEAEQTDLYDADEYLRKNMKIITTSAMQAAIDAAVSKLNQA